MWSEIFATYVLPLVAGLGGGGGIIIAIIMLWKNKAKIKETAKEAARSVIDEIKGTISVDINEVVENRLKKSTQVLDNFADNYFESQNAQLDVIEELGAFFSNSPLIDADSKKRMKDALERARKTNRGEIKKASLRLEYNPKNNKSVATRVNNDDDAVR